MNQYPVVINGITHTLQLSDADAKARGLTAEDALQDTTPVEDGAPTEEAEAEEAPTEEAPTEEAEAEEADVEAKAAPAPKNKSRQAANK